MKDVSRKAARRALSSEPLGRLSAGGPQPYRGCDPPTCTGLRTEGLERRLAGREDHHLVSAAGNAVDAQIAPNAVDAVLESYAGIRLSFAGT